MVLAVPSKVGKPAAKINRRGCHFCLVLNNWLILFIVLFCFKLVYKCVDGGGVFQSRSGLESAVQVDTCPLFMLELQQKGKTAGPETATQQERRLSLIGLQDIQLKVLPEPPYPEQAVSKRK